MCLAQLCADVTYLVDTIQSVHMAECSNLQVQNIPLSDKLDDDEGITQSNPLSDKLDDEGIPPMENNPLNSSDDEDITPYSVWWQEHKDAIQELFNRSALPH